MVNISVSDFIAKYLYSIGIDSVFLMSGTGSIYLDDGLEKIKEIKKIAFRNEATGPMMASAYARLKKTIGVVYVTTGPAGVNALSGVAEAWVDSIPVLIISGQVDQKYASYKIKNLKIRNFGIQELNIIELAKPITKYCSFVEDPTKILYELEKAISIAKSGRPGPVWLDIPTDVQKFQINPEKLEHYIPTKKKKEPINIVKLIELFTYSKKPVIIAGGGIHSSNSEKEFKEFADRIDVPIIFSRMGQDLLPYSHKNNFGHGGMKGTQLSSAILKEADLIISIGSRLAVPFLGEKKNSLAEGVKIISVDIDSNELNKPFYNIDLKIKRDCKEFFENIEPINFKSSKDWMHECNSYKKKYDSYYFIREETPIDIYHFISELDKKSNSNDIFVTDAGTSYFVTGQLFRFEHNQREVVSGAFASMGLAIPLSIGSSVAFPSKRILTITGDGSLETNIQELKTLSYYHLNVKLFVINNGGYVSIRISQDNYCDGRYINSEQNVSGEMLNFEKIADAFGLSYYRIQNHNSISSDLDIVLSNPNPLLIEVVCNPNQKIMSPFYEY